MKGEVSKRIQVMKMRRRGTSLTAIFFGLLASDPGVCEGI